MGRLILIAGDVATPASGGSGRVVTVRTGGAWLSDDGGRSWTAVTVPAGHGAADQFSDAAATADGFLLVRPATVDGVPAADVYRSGNGTAWTFAATLTTRAGFTPGLMNGNSAGAVLAGQSGGTLTAFTSADGVRWRQARAFGSAAETISGVAATQAGAVIAAGTSGAGTSAAGTSSSQLITIARRRGCRQGVSAWPPSPVACNPSWPSMPSRPQGRQQVAVGSANGFPAAWVSADGGHGWHRATGATPPVLTRPGIQQLTSVTHGRAGWLAVGGVTAAAPGHPVVIGSADGRVWSAADGEPAFTGSGLFTAQAAAGRDGYVIVGWQLVTPARTIAAAWWSAGLTGWLRAGDAVAGALDGAGKHADARRHRHRGRLPRGGRARQPPRRLVDTRRPDLDPGRPPAPGQGHHRRCSSTSPPMAASWSPRAWPGPRRDKCRSRLGRPTAAARGPSRRCPCPRVPRRSARWRRPAAASR